MAGVCYRLIIYSLWSSLPDMKQSRNIGDDLYRYFLTMNLITNLFKNSQTCHAASEKLPSSYTMCKISKKTINTLLAESDHVSTTKKSSKFFLDYVYYDIVFPSINQSKSFMLQSKRLGSAIPLTWKN